MDMELDPLQAAELHDALDACDELHTVLSRLKRLGLLSEDEDRHTKAQIEAITATLSEKLPDHPSADDGEEV
jgi:hypothetical protein